MSVCFRVLLLTLAWVSLTLVVRAQKKDTLKEVQVNATKYRTGDVKANEFAPGQQLVSMDSATLKQYTMQSVATMLSQQTSVFVKAYSFNGLATLNFRGASAAQSQVLWNGVPIQNAALGIADVSELPVMLLSRVSMVYGGSAALWGSGNVGGALLIENETPFFDSGKKTLSLCGSAGSFGQYALGIDGAMSGKKWYVSVKALGQLANNDFTYTTNAGTQQKMPNDQLQSGSLMLNTAWKPDRKNTVGFTAWYQQYDREIPPALFEPYSVKKQNDGSLRLLLNWEQKDTGHSWYARSSLIRDDVRYDDASVLLHTDNTAFQYYQEAGWKKQWNQYGRLLLFIPIQISWMKPTDSNSTKTQSRVALAAAYDIQLLHYKLNIAANARLENVNGSTVLLPGADAAYRLTSWLGLRANVQRTYRVPTLNELYYNPGGNSSLLPEQGWNEDAGYALHLQNSSLSFRQDASVFTRDIHDWIIWLGGAIWTPHNIAEVHSRGTTTENRLEYTLINKWKLHLGVNTSYIIATTVSSYIPNDGSIGNQIPYMPRYNGQLNVGFTIQNLMVNYNHSYTGYRFIVSDESEFLSPYQTGNLQLMYSTAVHQHAITFTAQCNNIWNQQYTIVANRPMPGINWLVGCRWVIM